MGSMQQLWAPRQLSPEQREEQRRAAAVLFPRVRRGRLSRAAIARQLGISREAVRQWYAAWEEGGVRALSRRPTPGHLAKLSAADWRRLARVLRRRAEASGYAAEQWTLQRVAHLIRREFGVRYHPRHLARPLTARGFRPQHARSFDQGNSHCCLSLDRSRSQSLPCRNANSGNAMTARTNGFTTSI